MQIKNIEHLYLATDENGLNPWIGSREPDKQLRKVDVLDQLRSWVDGKRGHKMKISPAIDRPTPNNKNQ